MISTILGLVGGIGGLVTAGAAALVAGWAGILIGKWRERAATVSKVEAAERRIIAEINEAGHERLAKAIEARRRADAIWDKRMRDDAG